MRLSGLEGGGHILTMNSGEVGINAVCRLFHLHLHSFCTLAVIELMATDRPVSKHAHAAGGARSLSTRWSVLYFWKCAANTYGKSGGLKADTSAPI